MSLPSGDGTNQSIATWPLGSISFGSSTIFSDARSFGDVSVTSRRCCFGAEFVHFDDSLV
jgi:hypothetical protein